MMIGFGVGISYYKIDRHVGDDAFIPNHFENIQAQIDFKINAMSCFKSQIRPFPSTRCKETIDVLAKFRGATVGFYRGEAFMTIRTINN